MNILIDTLAELPAEHADTHHYIPTTHGFEKDITKHPETIRSLQQKPEYQ